MAQFNHPNVLSLLAIVTDQQPNMSVLAVPVSSSHVLICLFRIIMELMVKGSLLGLFDKHGDDIDEPRLLTIAQDVAQGMAYLSSRGFVHRCGGAAVILHIFQPTNLHMHAGIWRRATSWLRTTIPVASATLA